MAEKSELNRAGVYAIVNTLNGRCYVGGTANIRDRWKRHRKGLNTGKHHSAEMQREYAECGRDCFLFKVLEFVPAIDSLTETEQKWMDALQAHSLGYNSAPVAGSMLGFTHSEEMKLNQSARLKGRKVSDETRLKMSQSRLGKHIPDDVRLKISAAHKGKKLSDEHIEKMRIARTGSKMTDAARAKISAANKGRVLTVMTDEIRAKISATLKARHLSKKILALSKDEPNQEASDV